jgi:tyrosinase
LQNDFPDQWNLYLLGLKDFQEVDQLDPLSYYQIAGIHGLPYRPWNGVEGNQVTGYCTHSSILFPTWHRPYLALFEQVLHAHVLKKASEFPESQGRARYEAAAREFRMPYWDWAVVVPPGQSILPASLSSRTISVITPSSGGQRTTIDNPLYSYRFNPINPSPGDFPNNTVATWQTTVRWPRNQTSESRNELITRSIEITNQNRSSNLRERLTLLVTRYRNYGPFSNQAWLQGRPAEYGSIEGVHDTVHTAIGGQGERSRDWPGHMSMVPYASFDPAFWLHHTNVDRLCAMWQAINPNTFVTSQASSNDTVTTAEGTIENIRTALTPFWKSSNDFYNSSDVRRTEPLGHAYPETQPWNYQSTRDYQASVRTAFRNLYGGSNFAFILANSPGGRLSAEAQIQTPKAETTAPEADKKTSQPSAQPSTTGQLESIKSSLQKAASLSANVVSSVQHGRGNDQKPLRDTLQSLTEKDDDKTKDAKAPQDTKDTSKDTESAHEDKAKGNVESQDNAKVASKVTESSQEDKEKEIPGDDKSHRSEHQGRNIKDLAPNDKYLEWITNLKVQKHALDGTFFVHVFLGDFNREDPLTWRFDPNLVGTFSILGDTVGTGCKKCQKDREDHLQITGQVPLTLALVERYLAGHIENLTPEKVVPYLQTNLHWRVAAASSAERSRGEVADLVVSVISNEVTVPTNDDEFPIYSDEVQVYPECTTARNGEGRGEGTGLTDPSQT